MKKKLLITVASIVCCVAVFIVLLSTTPIGSAINPPVTQQTPITDKGHVQAAHASVTPKPVQQTPVAKAKDIVLTYGIPHLGGQISDFLGKYGTHDIAYHDTEGRVSQSAISDPGKATWFLDKDLSGLSVDFDVHTGEVTWIHYSGSENWSKQQYENFMLTFAPDGTVYDKDTNNWWIRGGNDIYALTTYKSDSGNFFIRVSAFSDGTVGSADMNIRTTDCRNIKIKKRKNKNGFLRKYNFHYVMKI